MTKNNNENFESSAKCSICSNTFLENDVKVRDHCHMTGTYRGAAYKDINVIDNNVIKIVISM